MPLPGFLNPTVAVALILVGLLSGVLAIVRDVQLMYFPAKVEDRKVFWAFVRIAFVLSAIFLWCDEHNKVMQLSGKPQQPILQVTLPPPLLALLEKQLTPLPLSGHKETTAPQVPQKTGKQTSRAELPTKKKNDAESPAKPPLPIETLMFTQRQVSSDRSDYPYAVEVVVQTTTPIQPVSLMFACSSEVEELQPRLAVSFSVAIGYVTGHKELALLKFDSPGITPDKPLVVVLKSKQDNKVLAVRRFEF
jgi:hypothetical protein